MKVILALLALFLIWVPPAQATTYTITTLNYCGTNNCDATGLNNAGTVVGTAYLGGGMVQGYTYTAAGGYNGLVSSARAYCISNGGVIAGSYTGNSDKYVYDGSSYYDISDMPGNPTGIYGGGPSLVRMVGSSGTSGFIYTYEMMTHSGSSSTFNLSGVWSTNLYGINDSDNLVGSYLDYSYKTHGFVSYDNGWSYTTLDFTGATSTIAYGISNNGTIVGTYDNHGFIYANNQFTTFDVPGALYTDLYGVNNSGQLAGYYYDPANGGFGFLATPNPVPLPPSWLLLGSALTGLAALRRRRLP